MNKVKKVAIPPNNITRGMWPYMHVVVDPEVVARVKRLAGIKGYKFGAMVEMLLRIALDNVE